MRGVELGYTEGEGLSSRGVGLYSLRSRIFLYKVWALATLSLYSSGAKVLAEAIGKDCKVWYIYMTRATLERIDSECSPRGVEVGRLRCPLVVRAYFVARRARMTWRTSSMRSTRRRRAGSSSTKSSSLSAGRT